MNKAKIVAVAVDKGGSGKTTTTFNTAAGLAAKGYKVLVIDVDQQANLTQAFLGEPPAVTLYDALMDDNTHLPVYSFRKNLDLVPASHQMFGVGLKLMLRQVNSQENRDCRMILRGKLEPWLEKYDYILIDCPPSDNLMTINALYATVNVVIVANPEPFSVYGVKNFVNMMWQVRKDVNPRLRLAGILLNNWECNSAGHIKAEKALKLWAPQHLFATKIRHSRPLYTSILAHQDVFTYFPDSNGAIDFRSFIEEFLYRVK